LFAQVPSVDTPVLPPVEPPVREVVYQLLWGSPRHCPTGTDVSPAAWRAEIIAGMRV